MIHDIKTRPSESTVMLFRTIRQAINLDGEPMRCTTAGSPRT